MTPAIVYNEREFLEANGRTAYVLVQSTDRQKIVGACCCSFKIFRAPDNYSIDDNLRSIAKEIGREIATPNEAREILGIRQRINSKNCQSAPMDGDV